MPGIGPNILTGLRDVSLPLGLILDSCLLCSAIHGSHYLSHESYMIGKTRSAKADQSAEPGNATVNQ